MYLPTDARVKIGVGPVVGVNVLFVAKSAE
jgi:hypothetical protein